MRRAVAVVTIAIVAASCAPLKERLGGSGRAPPSQAAIPHTHSTEAQLEQALIRYSKFVEAMDARGVASMYAPDGVMERQSGPPLRGPKEIHDFLAAAGGGVRVLSNEMRTVSLAFNGPVVVQTGDFRQAAKAPNGKVINAEGRFEVTWIRGPRGQWLIKRMLTRRTG